MWRGNSGDSESTLSLDSFAASGLRTYLTDVIGWILFRGMRLGRQFGVLEWKIRDDSLHLQ